METLPISRVKVERAVQPFLWCQRREFLALRLSSEGVRGKDANGPIHTPRI